MWYLIRYNTINIQIGKYWGLTLLLTNVKQIIPLCPYDFKRVIARGSDLHHLLTWGGRSRSQKVFVLLSSWWEENLQEDNSMYFVLQVLKIRLAPFAQYWSLSTLPCTQVMQDVSLSGFDAWYTRLYHQHFDGKYNQVSLADQQYIC